MTIPELYDNELSFWSNENIKFLGVRPIDDTQDFSVIQNQIDEDCEKYWNTDNPCKLASKFNDGTLNKDYKKQTKNSYKLKLNFYNMCIEIWGDYGGELLQLGAMPTPCIDLCWIINKSHYVPKVISRREYRCVRKVNFDYYLGEGWSYTRSTDQFKNKEQKVLRKRDVFNRLSYRSKCLLSAVLGEEVTVDTFTDAIIKVPSFSRDSIFNYNFERVEYFENLVFKSKKYANPTKRIFLGVNTIMLSLAPKFYHSNNIEGVLVRSDSKIFALENFRSCENIYIAKDKDNKFIPEFSYTDINGFFDSFKTVTTKHAGRQRLLLDNVVLKQGMLWVIEPDGTMHNMFEYINKPQNKRLSCLSKSPFCNNDKPKRMMMNAKMTSQAVPLADEVDDLTHRIKARVGFTDLKGYTSADSAVISESFAKKLGTWDMEILYLDKRSNLYKFLTENPDFSELYNRKMVFPKKSDAVLSSFENIRVDHIDDVSDHQARVFLKWDIPFRLGDKLTNLHGAKGTVGLILPDDEMPRLTKKVGNMKPGPLDIIISGYSTIKRGSLGQIFEAWALASGIDVDNDEDFIAIEMDKHKTQMKNYAKNSIVEFDGQTQVIPVGINYIMRLYHHASTKVSCSSADFAYKRTLKFGEMEKLNLVANDCPAIMKELGIRSIVKYIGSHKLIREMEETGELPNKARMSLRFAEVLKTMGYDLQISNFLSNNYSNIDEVDMARYNSIMGEENNEDNNSSDTD